MANDCFRFKQFSVVQDRCAMKVGTDGVILGAWTPINNAKRILDIGTGTGLIALMLAQRSDAHIVALEIDDQAAQQAQENVASSPFGERVEVVNCDVNHFVSEELFDLIVSNPPYFQKALIPPSKSRATARHCEEGLTFQALVSSARRLLRPDGNFAVIIPKDAEKDFINVALVEHFSLSHHVSIHTIRTKPPKRVMLYFQKTILPVATVYDTLVLSDNAGTKRSKEYADLTQDFYL